MLFFSHKKLRECKLYIVVRFFLLVYIFTFVSSINSVFCERNETKKEIAELEALLAGATQVIPQNFEIIFFNPFCLAHRHPNQLYYLKKGRRCGKLMMHWSL